jgi:hypothetical protein
MKSRPHRDPPSHMAVSLQKRAYCSRVAERSLGARQRWMLDPPQVFDKHAAEIALRLHMLRIVKKPQFVQVMFSARHAFVVAPKEKRFRHDPELTQQRQFRK